MSILKTINAIRARLTGSLHRELDQNYEEDSWEAMIYVACLVMWADKKIRRGEFVTLTARGPGSLIPAFADAMDSAGKGDLEVIQSNIGSEGSSAISSQSRLDEIQKNCRDNLQRFPSELVLQKAAEKIQNKEKKELVMLGAVRMAACDLHISVEESKFLNFLASLWELNDLLKKLVSELPSWEHRRTNRLFRSFKKSRESYASGIKDLIESGTLSPRAYRRLEELIAEIEPSLELQDDYKELYELAEEITADKEKEVEELEELSIEQEETIQNLEQNMEEMQGTIKELERQSVYGNNRKSINFILTSGYPNLLFHSSSGEILLNHFPKKSDLYQHLEEINSGNPRNSVRVRGTKWREIRRVQTGDPDVSDLGRIYFLKQSGNKYRYKVYISVKKNESDQKQTIDLLKSWT